MKFQIALSIFSRIISEIRLRKGEKFAMRKMRGTRLLKASLSRSFFIYGELSYAKIMENRKCRSVI